MRVELCDDELQGKAEGVRFERAAGSPGARVRVVVARDKDSVIDEAGESLVEATPGV